MFRCLVFALLAGSSALSQGIPASSAAPARAALAHRIAAYARPYVESNNFTGVILVERGGRVLFEKGYGMANYELNVPNTPKARFHIASASKTFTSAAILLLEERGQLSSSDPVAKYIPDYPDGDKLRIEHLLKHTSGIPNLGNLPEWEREERFPHTPEELVAMFKDKPLEFEPGSKYRYSNSNYNLLALILEKVSGQSYGDFLQANIFGPLGLHSTVHDGDMTRLILDRASGTEPEGVHGVRFPRYVDWSGRTGNGSLVTTASDLDHFLRALLGGRLLQAESLAKIVAPAPGFAYGWVRNERFGRKQINTGGRSPGFNASVEHYLDDDTTVIVLSNSYSPVAQDEAFLQGLHSVIFGKKATPPALTPVPPKPGELAEFASRYQMPHNYFAPDMTLRLVDRGDHLDLVWADGGTNAVYPVGPNRFLDRNYWARLSFTRDGSGHVTGFTYRIGQEYMARRLTTEP